MFLDGLCIGVGLLFLSQLYLSPADRKPSKLVGGVIAILSWLVAGPIMMDTGALLARVYIASIPVAFFLLLPLIYWYQKVLMAYGDHPRLDKHAKHWLPVLFASLLSLSIGLMPSEDFNNMFFNETDQLSVWVTINSAGFGLLLLGWTVLSFFYLGKMVMNTKKYHQQLNSEFANHEGKRLDWLIGFTGLLVFAWFYALLVLALSADASTPLISETALSLLVLVLMWMFSVQALNRKPAFMHSDPQPVPVPVPEADVKPESAPVPRDAPGEVPEQKYSNSSIDEERLKRIATKVEQKVIAEEWYLNPDIDATTLAREIGISVHYLSQVLSQEMQTTFYNYINNARIDAAKALLTSSESTVLEIAMAVGFNTRSSFYNAFKKKTGLTPSKYKASTV